MVHLRKYGTSTTVDFDLFEIDGVDFRVDATFATGDVTIMKDEGAEANITTLPTDEGSTYSVPLSATEMQAARIVIILVDQTATKVWLDRKIIIESYGNASAQHAFDLDTAVQGVNAIQISGDTTAANNLELDYDGTGYNKSNSTIGTTTNLTTNNDKGDYNIASIDANAITAASIASSALNGKGDWNIGKTGYTLTQAFPTNFEDMSITNTTGLVDITQTAADKSWSTTVRDLTVKTGFSLSATGLDAIASTATGMVEIAKAIWDRILTGATHNITNSAGRRLRTLAGSVFTDGTAQSGGNNTIQLASGDVTINSQFVRSKVIITSGTGQGQEAIITDSVASTDTLTITPAWVVNPDATSDYDIIPAQAHSTVRNGGYDNGTVFYDDNGTAGTQKGVNGTSTNPVSSEADAYTIAAQENLTRISVAGGSTFTLPSDSTGFAFEGEGYNIELNGQEIGSATFMRTNSVTGIGINTSGGNPPNFTLCGIGSVTLPPATGIDCGFFGTFTIGTAGNFTFGGSSEVFNASLTLDYGVSNNASQFFLTSWGGGRVEIQNAGANTGSYVFEMNGIGTLEVNANCSATTTVTLRGSINHNAEVSGVTYVEIANMLTDHIISDSVAFLGADIASIDTKIDDIQGATFNTSTDSLEAIRDRGDAAWVTGAGGSAPTVGQIADAVWDEVQSGHTTAGTFGKFLDTEVSGVGGGSAADIADAVWDEALSGHTTAGTGGKVLSDAATAVSISGLNDVAVTDIVSAGAITTSSGSVSSVTTVSTTTTNTDMRGTDSAATASALSTVDTNVDAILVDTGTTIPAQISGLNNFDPSSETVANVTTVGTTTTNTDMRGTDNAATATALATVDSNVDAIKAKTDNLTFTKANELDSNIKSVNDVEVTGTGANGDTWGPV